MNYTETQLQSAIDAAFIKSICSNLSCLANKTNFNRQTNSRLAIARAFLAELNQIPKPHKPIPQGYKLITEPQIVYPNSRWLHKTNLSDFWSAVIHDREGSKTSDKDLAAFWICVPVDSKSGVHLENNKTQIIKSLKKLSIDELSGGEDQEPKEGNVVQLKSGGNEMTVFCCFEDKATCGWFDAAKTLVIADIPFSALKIIE